MNLYESHATQKAFSLFSSGPLMSFALTSTSPGTKGQSDPDCCRKRFCPTRLRVSGCPRSWTGRTGSHGLPMKLDKGVMMSANSKGTNFASQSPERSQYCHSSLASSQYCIICYLATHQLQSQWIPNPHIYKLRHCFWYLLGLSG
eukprot:s1551_g28.t1